MVSRTRIRSRPELDAGGKAEARIGRDTDLTCAAQCDPAARAMATGKGKQSRPRMRRALQATGTTRGSATVLAVTVADSPVGPSGTSRRKAHFSTRSLDATPRSHHRAAAASSAAWLYTRAARPAVLQHAARTRHATHGTHGRSASSDDESPHLERPSTTKMLSCAHN